MSIVLALGLMPTSAFAGTGRAASPSRATAVSSAVKAASATQATNLAKATITLAKTAYVYDGKAKKPGVTVKIGKKKVAASNYKLVYAAGRKNVGVYKVTVKGKGTYRGSKSATFAINPKGTSIQSVTAAAGCITAKWKKQATQTSGYQLQYGLKGDFKSGAKTVTVGKAATTSVKVSKLTAGKRYYVRIRTFKTLGGTKRYSAWSAAKSALVPAKAPGVVEPVSPVAERTYDSKATGAPRAKGRTAATVAELVKAAQAETATRAANDLVGVSSDAVPAVVHVKQFGAVGDGEHDDHDALQAAFDSGAATILFEAGAAYRTNKSLSLTRGDVTLLGAGATIFTDAAYVDGNERLFSVTGQAPASDVRADAVENWKNHPEYFIGDVGIYQLNLEARAYGEETAPSEKWQEEKPGEAKRLAYTQQLMVQYAHNVDIYGCTLSYAQPDAGQVVDGCTGFDLYTGWHDVTIEGCTVRDFCDKESGGGIWIRDLFNMGASNLVFKGNDLSKTCHDEILAVFSACKSAVVGGSAEKEATRLISDVLIVENTFKMTERDASPSVMCFTVKQASGVLVENNVMDTMSWGGLVWAEESAGVVVRDNVVRHTRSRMDEDKDFLMFRGTIALAEKNTVTLDEADAEKRGHVNVFSMNGIVRANKVTSNIKVENVTDGGTVEGNVFELNGAAHVVFNNSYRVANNQVVLKAPVDDYVQYFMMSFSTNAAVCGNVFDNQVDDAGKNSYTVISVNQSTLSDRVIEFSGNRLVNKALGSKARMLYLVTGDAGDQSANVIISGNDIPDFSRYGFYPENLKGRYQALKTLAVSLSALVGSG